MNLYAKKNKGFLNQVELKRVRYKLLYWSLFAIAMLVCLITLLPLLWMITSAFKTTEEFLQIPPTIIPRSFEIEKLGKVWEKSGILQAYISTLILAGGSLVFHIGMCGIAGYVLAVMKPAGTKQLLTILLWCMMIPGSNTLVPLFMTFIDFPILHLNLMNTYWPMWLMAAVNVFDVILFKNYFNTISGSLSEAAKLDGCNNLQVLTKIMLPLAMPLVITLSIFSLTNSFSNYFWPNLVLKDNWKKPIALKIMNMKAGLTTDEYMVALLYISVPPIVFYLLFQKHITHSINIGGVKG